VIDRILVVLLYVALWAILSAGATAVLYAVNLVATL
jgi:hypothetical protein